MSSPDVSRASKGQTLFAVRDDYSIFVSVASYRDDNCPKTLTEMYSKAAHPERLFVGLVQQVTDKFFVSSARVSRTSFLGRSCCV